MLPPKLLVQVLKSAAKLKKCSESNNCIRNATLAQQLKQYADRLRKIKVVKDEIASMFARKEITSAQKDILMSKRNAEHADVLHRMTEIKIDAEYIKCQLASCKNELLAHMGALIETLRVAVKKKKDAGHNATHAEDELARLVALKKARNVTVDAVHEMILMAVSLNLQLA